MMQLLRVVTVDGEPQICVRDKEVETMHEIFFTRYDLHRKGKLSLMPLRYL